MCVCVCVCVCEFVILNISLFILVILRINIVDMKNCNLSTEAFPLGPQNPQTLYLFENINVNRKCTRRGLWDGDICDYAAIWCVLGRSLYSYRCFFLPFLLFIRKTNPSDRVLFPISIHACGKPLNSDLFLKDLEELKTFT